MLDAKAKRVVTLTVQQKLHQKGVVTLFSQDAPLGYLRNLTCFTGVLRKKMSFFEFVAKT
jgi:hypothetical protein